MPTYCFQQLALIRMSGPPVFVSIVVSCGLSCPPRLCLYSLLPVCVPSAPNCPHSPSQVFKPASPSHLALWIIKCCLVTGWITVLILILSACLDRLPVRTRKTVKLSDLPVVCSAFQSCLTGSDTHNPNGFYHVVATHPGRSSIRCLS